MTASNPLLTRRAVVQAGMETTYNTPATLGTNDGILTSEPTFTVEPNVLERDFTRDDLSPQAIIVGRKLARMEFRTEMRSNNKAQSGLINDAPIISRLFRACGYEMLPSATPSTIGVYDIGDVTNPIAWAVNTSAADNTDVITYFLKVTKGGVSGTAEVTVTSDTLGEGTAAAALTTGTVKNIGTHGLALTPTFTGSLVQGTEMVIWLLPPGIRLKPRSDGFESVTLKMNKDGVLHLMPGAYGTFTIEAEAGNYASISWTFTGTWVQPTDAVAVQANYEKSLPHQIELARLRLNDFSAIVNKFTYNQGNDIQIRPDVNSKDGYIGTRIVGRKPEGGVDPEAELVANYDFWGRMADAKRMPFQMRAGVEPGNTVWMFAPNAQYSGLTYADRNGILTYDAGLRFSGYNGNDEMNFFFC